MDFIARTGPGEIALWLEDRYVILSHVRSASGAKYQEGDTVFWSKGEEAMLSVGGQTYPECKLAPARVPWEDARRRAVDFRAVGNEPGWSLEIKNGQQLLLVGDYGMQRVMLPDPGFQPTADGRVYHAVSGTDDLVIEIVDGQCVDSMSGASFPSQVNVTWNGRMLSGCGMALDHPWE
jgi:putative lipoprotein